MTSTMPAQNLARCVRCRAALTNPTSVALGIGPICRGRKGDTSAPEHQADERQVHLGADVGMGFILQRLSGNIVATNVPWLVCFHSPDGFEWGYAGCGPADLALNMAECVLRNTGHKQRGRKRVLKEPNRGELFSAAWDMHHDLKDRFLVGMPKDGGIIPYDLVYEWMQEWMTKPKEE